MDKLTLSFKSGDTLYASLMTSIVSTINTLVDEIDSLKLSAQGGNSSSGNNDGNQDPQSGDDHTPSTTETHSAMFDFNKLSDITFANPIPNGEYGGFYCSLDDNVASVGNVAILFHKGPGTQIGLYGSSAQDSDEILSQLYVGRAAGFTITVPNQYRITRITFDHNIEGLNNSAVGYYAEYSDDTYFKTQDRSLIAERSTNTVDISWANAAGFPKYTNNIYVQYEIKS